MWDPDIVEAHNRPNQFMYTPADVGDLKVAGMKRFVERQGFETEILTQPYAVTPDETRLTGIVISGVDSMNSRHAIWQAIRTEDYLIDTYIDARIGDEFVHVMTVDPNNPRHVELYERTLFTEDEVPDLGCTTRENAHSAFAAAQIVSINLTLLLAGEPVKEAVYRNLRQEARKSVQRPLSTSQQGGRQ